MGSSGDARQLYWAGALAIATGAFIMLMASGVMPTQGGGNSPSWVGYCAGSAFLFAGMAILLRGIAGGTASDRAIPEAAPLWMHVAQYLLGLAIIGGLGAIGTWVAFGPGERAFSISIPFVLSPRGNEFAGRIAFGFGALLAWVFFAVAATYWGKRLLRRINSPAGTS
jgi:hypothetical protein